jgi:hypothetical protein
VNDPRVIKSTPREEVASCLERLREAMIAQAMRAIEEALALETDRSRES